jgi:hypothetical protein
LINITHYFDKIEETYNSLLEEFETRKNGSWIWINIFQNNLSS